MRSFVNAETQWMGTCWGSENFALLVRDEVVVSYFKILVSGLKGSAFGYILSLRNLARFFFFTGRVPTVLDIGSVFLLFFWCCHLSLLALVN